MTTQQRNVINTFQESVSKRKRCTIFLSTIYHKKLAFTKLRDNSIQVTIRQHGLQFAHSTRSVARNDCRVISVNKDMQQVEDQFPSIVNGSKKIENIVDVEEE